MQWKDYETEIAHREKIRLGLRKVQESYLSPFSNPITLHGNNAPSMGQLEQIGSAGKVVHTSNQYSKVMLDLLNNNKYYQECSSESRRRYKQIYSLDSVISNYINLFEEIING